VASESVGASITIKASPEAIFEVLIDPANHAAIDGTGWVRQSLDYQVLTASGQIFRMAMYHPNHPDGNYEMANLVEVFDPPHAVAWKPGYDTGDGSLSFGGWTWRYDLVPLGPFETKVTLSYDWSAVTEEVLRRQDHWPPFSSTHLDDSLIHFAELIPT
jgi:hypothetical protein